MIRLATHLARDRRGAMAVETALIAPVLMTLCLFGYDISAVVARQSELQTAAEQAVEIAQAVNPTTSEQYAQIERVVSTSTGLEVPGTTTQSLKVYPLYRCGTVETLTTTPGTCDTKLLSTYLKIEMRDVYVPQWRQLGMGSDFNFKVDRTVQLS